MKENIPTIALKEFVSETLIQIIEGVKQAQEKFPDHSAKINPISVFREKDGFYKFDPSGYGQEEYGQLIEFDVAVTAVDKGDLKGGIGVLSGVVNLGYKAEKDLDTGSISRIKFSIPVFLPQQNIRKLD